MAKDDVKNYYVYPAIFHFWKDEDGLTQTSVTFPDFPGLISGPGPNATFEEALEVAREGLALHLEGLIEDGDLIPEPTPTFSLSYDRSQEEGGMIFVALVDVVLPLFKNRKTEFVRVNVTIPKWLKEISEEKKVNYSKVLREGLINVLNLRHIED